MDIDFFILYFEGSDIIINVFVVNKEKDILQKRIVKKKNKNKDYLK